MVTGNTRKVIWTIIVVFAIVVGLYPAIYFFIDREFGLLSFKSDHLLMMPIWNIGFYTHIITGGLALLIGWTQFGSRFRENHLSLHRNIGKVYIISVLISSIAAMGISLAATGGLVSALGFFSLGLIWLYTTVMAYSAIKNGRIQTHRKMMVYSYAVCFSAVTLRIWLPLLVLTFGDFTTAYTIVAWLCWIPNVLVAYLITRRLSTRVSGHPSVGSA